MTDYSVQLFLGPFISLSPYITFLNVLVLSLRVKALSEFDIKNHLWVRDLQPFLEEGLTKTTQMIETIGPNTTVKNLGKRNEHKNRLKVFPLKIHTSKSIFKMRLLHTVPYQSSNQSFSTKNENKIRFCAIWNLIV